jgi:antitoxin (DNA-binding transcriptional repressor) of toxin-antitoxin stability system
VIDAAIAGDPTVITRHGKPVAKIVRYEEAVSDLSIFDQQQHTEAHCPKGFSLTATS